MAFTTTQLAAIEEAIASGTLTVKYSDKQVTYQSTTELLRVRDVIRRELGLVATASTRVYPSVSKFPDTDEK